MWRWLLRAAAVLAGVAALVLVAVALDVLRASDDLESDDVSFEAAPRRQRPNRRGFRRRVYKEG